jgi:hypothetical protein
LVLTLYQTPRFKKHGRVLNIWLTATTLVDKFGEVYAIATTEREIISQEQSLQPGIAALLSSRGEQS